MPVTTGTSFVGFQRLGFLAVGSNRLVNVFPNNFNGLNRNVRIGTFLICFDLGNGARPVSFACPLYGSGLAIGTIPWLPNATLEVWVQWYIQGFPWQCITP